MTLKIDVRLNYTYRDPNNKLSTSERTEPVSDVKTNHNKMCGVIIVVYCVFVLKQVVHILVGFLKDECCNFSLMILLIPSIDIIRSATYLLIRYPHVFYSCYFYVVSTSKFMYLHFLV